MVLRIFVQTLDAGGEAFRVIPQLIDIVIKILKFEHARQQAGFFLQLFLQVLPGGLIITRKPV